MAVDATFAYIHGRPIIRLLMLRKKLEKIIDFRIDRTDLLFSNTLEILKDSGK